MLNLTNKDVALILSIILCVFISTFSAEAKDIQDLKEKQKQKLIEMSHEKSLSKNRRVIGRDIRVEFIDTVTKAYLKIKKSGLQFRTARIMPYMGYGGDTDGDGWSMSSKHNGEILLKEYNGNSCPDRFYRLEIIMRLKGADNRIGIDLTFDDKNIIIGEMTGTGLEGFFDNALTLPFQKGAIRSNHTKIYTIILNNLKRTI